MSLQITMSTLSNVLLTNSIHKIMGLRENRFAKSMKIDVGVYKDNTEKDANNPVFWDENNKYVTIQVLNDEYDTYFAVSVLDASGMNHIKSAYNYLKTQDPDVPGYTGHCPFDYKNDSTDT